LQAQDEWDDEDDDGESESDTVDWKLGFVDEPSDKNILQPQYFPSKVGGVPIWYPSGSAIFWKL
jgi:hypothetical protein